MRYILRSVNLRLKTQLMPINSSRQRYGTKTLLRKFFSSNLTSRISLIVLRWFAAEALVLAKDKITANRTVTEMERGLVSFAQLHMYKFMY